MKFSLCVVVLCLIFGFVSAQSDCVFKGSFTCSGGPISGIVMGDDEDDESFEYFLAVENGGTTSCSLVQQGDYEVDDDTVNVEFEIDDDECVISGDNQSQCSCVESLSFTASNQCTTLTSSNGDVCTPNEPCDDSFTCPGGATPQADPNNPATTNGCGPSSFPLAGPSFSFLECCNQHDICYETCGSSKIACDNDFYTCMFCSCGAEYDDFFSQLACEELACSYFQAVDEFGCSAFGAAQEQACICPGKSKPAPREASNKFGPANQSIRETELFCDPPFTVDEAECPVVQDDDIDTSEGVYTTFSSNTSNTSRNNNSNSRNPNPDDDDNTSNNDDDDDIFFDDDSSSMLACGIILIITMLLI